MKARLLILAAAQELHIRLGVCSRNSDNALGVPFNEVGV